MKKKRKRATINFFIIVFISGLFINHSFALHQESQEIKKLENLEKQKPSEVIKVPIVEYKAGDLRDPFQKYLKKRISEVKPVEKASLPLPSLTVQGIIWGGDLPQAIINNKVVKKGDTIEGVRIVDINKNGVAIFFEGQQYNLSSPAKVNLQSLGQNPKGGEDE